MPAPCPTPNGGNSYLRDYLGKALLRNTYSIADGVKHTPFLDWVGTTDMDTMETTFEARIEYWGPNNFFFFFF